MERPRSASRRSAVRPRSPSFCVAMEPRKRVREMSARIKVAVLIVFVLCCFLWPSGKFFAREKGGAMALRRTSPDSSDGEVIPKKFTCDTNDGSPRLEGKRPPANAESFPRSVDDRHGPGGRRRHRGVEDI